VEICTIGEIVDDESDAVDFSDSTLDEDAIKVHDPTDEETTAPYVERPGYPVRVGNGDSVLKAVGLEVHVVCRVEEAAVAPSVEELPYPEGLEADADSVSELDAQVVCAAEEVAVAPSVEELPYPIGEDAEADSVTAVSELETQVVWKVEELAIAPSVEELPYPEGPEADADSVSKLEARVVCAAEELPIAP
jgi:hypothetical protein